MNDSFRVRKSAVAGSFYPGDPATLRNEVSALLDDVERVPPMGRPIVLVEPHAGYAYSGRVAAHGYRLLQGLDIDRVVVVSPSHMEYFPFVSIFDGDAYETPLGDIPVDGALAGEIASADPLLQMSDRGHMQTQLSRREHALEVQLPFLQTVLDSFRVVPIVMGDQNWESCRALGEALGPILKRPDIVVIASSDLSHFYPYDVAKAMDAVFLETLEQMEPWRLYESVKQKSCEACGAGPVIASLIASQHVDSAACRILAAANSGDVTGDRERVVGYAAAVVVERDPSARDELVEEEEAELPLGETERTFLLEHARRAIEEALGVSPKERPRPVPPSLAVTVGAFVTLNVRNRLRGCIGSLAPQKTLGPMVADLAVAAAFNDPRFPGLTAEELPDLRIEISILSKLRQVSDPGDIRIGRHGLVVESGGKRGLLLPQVAVEHGWDPVAFLEYASEKAALPRTAWKDPAARIYVFTATVFGEEKEIAS